GETIFAEYKTDDNGKQTKIDCNKPCQKSDVKECPAKCKMSGILYFYILELLKEGHQPIFTLNIGTRKDIVDIQTFIDNLAEEVSKRSDRMSPPETIKNSPVISEEFRMYKPVVMYKVSQHNTHYKRNYWYVNLKLHPAWVRSFEAYILLKQRQALALAPTQELVAIAHGKSFMRKVEQVNDELPQAWKPSSQDIAELEVLFEENEWTKEGFVRLLKDRYNLNSSEDFNLLNKEQWLELRTALGSLDAKNIYC
ncbi:MAG: hypothetical protein AAGF26_15250, partial [Cyanobacteria bacterium P01_G01_bin.49]